MRHNQAKTEEFEPTVKRCAQEGLNKSSTVLLFGWGVCGGVDVVGESV